MAKSVYDLARKKIFSCFDSDTISVAADIMQSKNISSIIVKDKDHKTVGIVTVGDILRLVARYTDLKYYKMKDIMTSPLVSAPKDISINKAKEIFKSKKITRLALLSDSGEVVGILRDIELYKYQSFVRIDRTVSDMETTHHFDYFG